MTVVTHSHFKEVGQIDAARGRATAIWAQDRNDRILMQLRDDIPTIKMPGTMGFFGGHVEADEDLDVCAVREFKEETGILVGLDELMPKIVFTSPTSDMMLIYVFELSRRISPSDIVVQEGAGFAFLNVSQFDRFPILPAVRIAAEQLAKP